MSVFEGVNGKTVADRIWLLNRIPQYSTETLTEWYKSDVPEHTSRVLRYLTDRTTIVLEILDEAQVVTKNA